MARRRRTSAFEDFISLVSRFPWWVGLLLAVVAWFGLHAVAVEKPGPLLVTNPKQFSDNLSEHFFWAFAALGQYVLPAICVRGRLFRWWRELGGANSCGMWQARAPRVRRLMA